MMPTRRAFLCAGLAVAGLPVSAQTDDRWGALRGYPESRSSFERLPEFRVGNYSGGHERSIRHHVIQAGNRVAAWNDAPLSDFRYRSGLQHSSPDAYLAQWPVTGLLIARDNHILFERYRFARQPSMRLQSWSMAKSVTSLLLGICLDRGLIASLDDPAARYLPELAGTLHGETSLRHLANMCSGADVVHARDNAVLYPGALLGRDPDIARTVRAWNQRSEPAGTRFNYNELCPLTLGMVMRRVTGGSLSAFTEKALWQPLGAESSATWFTDARGAEFNSIGFAARLRDWARLGHLVAQRGRGPDGRAVVSEAWINECTSWSERDAPVRHGRVRLAMGYKALFWHARADGSRPAMHGHHGQRVLIDLPTRTVLVHTAVDQQGAWEHELQDMFDAATQV
ncbi:beta-lactamase family protein [Hydrogenophaga sp. RAC07]|uniref:serine hydrolase domain-containing protein n=1 Tax=Hydrogenophaga sp. RAC07 TaxID=1842537 RepID=UPI00083CF9F6|nr:serine hydrolase [Hydrogenophaga sp. RAC07]AOF86153.1 beta-lactamase family protein [Hydrogenophaga sp. RAC07]